jgi:uncharacterized membrane protein YgcG
MERSLVQALIEFPTRNPSIPAMIGRLGVRTVSIPVERKMRPVGRSTYTEPWSRTCRVRSAANVVSALHVRLIEGEQARVWDKGTKNFDAWAGWVVGGALARGIAWGAGFAIGNAIWDGFDWSHGNIRVDIDKNVNINKHVDRNNVNVGNWQHDSKHRRGVSYNNKDVRHKYAKTNVRSGDRKLDYRGRGGEQVLKPGTARPGGGERPNLGGDGSLISARDPAATASGRGQGSLEGKKPDLGKAKQQARPKPNAFDASDGAKARDYSKRGQASLGDRGPSQMARPSGGGGHQAAKGGGQRMGGGGGGHIGGGGRGGGGGGRGGGGRRR